MKYLLCLFLLIGNRIHAQEIVKVVHDDKQPMETFYVLKSDKTIKQGKYVQYFREHKLIDGHYTNSQKDSIWSYYNEEGKLITQYDYSQDKVLVNIITEKEKQKKYKIIYNDNLIETELDHPPMYPGGATLYLAMNVNYPDEAREHLKGGKVIVSFTINVDGSMSNIDVPNQQVMEWTKKHYA